MGDNIYLGDRNGVRTPMQWTADRNGGFSQADPARLYAPSIMDPVYGYQAVNVEAQERSPFSLLNWMRRMIALRRRHRVFGRGTIGFSSPTNRKVLAYVREYEGETILCVANLSRSAQPVDLDLPGYAGRVPVEMMGDTEFPRIGESPYFVTLGPVWQLLVPAAARRPSRRTPARPVPRSAPKPPDALDLRPLLLGLDWRSAFDTATHEILERDYLPVHLATRRWFAGDARRLRAVRIRDHIRIATANEPAFVTLLDVTFEDGGTETYLLPVGFLSGEAGERLLRDSPELVIARVSGARKGVMHERLDYGVVERMLAAVRDGTSTTGGTADWSERHRTGCMAAELDTMGATRLNAEQRNTSYVVGERVIAKLIRRVEPRSHPELETGRHLTDRVPFEGAPAADRRARVSERRRAAHRADGGPRLRRPSRTAWEQTIDELGRYFEAAAISTDAPTPGSGRRGRSHRLVRGRRQATRQADGRAASCPGDRGR